MAHKTLVGGTAYEITGGKTLVDGTAYSIKSGKTLVGGTVYEVGFAEMATVTITGSGDSYLSYVTIDGKNYTSETTLSVPVGTIVYCHVGDEGKDGSPYVSLNGAYISERQYTITGNIGIYLRTRSYKDKNDNKYYYGIISITEE